VQLPLVLPPVATGFALLLLFGREGWIGATLAKAGIVFAFNWTGAALAAGVMAFPLMVAPIRLAIEANRPRGQRIGHHPGRRAPGAVVRLTVPLAAPGLIAGAVLGFAKALGEFGATITFAGAIPGETLTLPAAIWSATQSPAPRAGPWCVPGLGRAGAWRSHRLGSRRPRGGALGARARAYPFVAAI